MEFTLEELESILEEMGFKDIPQNQLEDFSKDLKRLIRHDIRAKKKRGTSANNVGPPVAAPTFEVPTVSPQLSKKNCLRPELNDSNEKIVEDKKLQQHSNTSC